MQLAWQQKLNSISVEIHSNWLFAVQRKKEKISFAAILTCQWGETFQPVLAASWPSGCCGQSCPHRSTPPPWLWAGEPGASPASGQSSALQHCSRFCLGKWIMHKQNVLPMNYKVWSWNVRWLLEHFTILYNTYTFVMYMQSIKL